MPATMPTARALHVPEPSLACCSINSKLIPCEDGSVRDAQQTEQGMGLASKVAMILH